MFGDFRDCLILLASIFDIREVKSGNYRHRGFQSENCKAKFVNFSMIGAGVFDELTSVAISNFVRSKEVHE